MLKADPIIVGDKCEHPGRRCLPRPHRMSNGTLSAVEIPGEKCMAAQTKLSECSWCLVVLPLHMPR